MSLEQASQKSQIIFPGGSSFSLKCIDWLFTWQLNHDSEEMAQIPLLNMSSLIAYEKLQPLQVSSVYH